MIRLEATAAVAADDEAGEQRGAVARAPLGAGTGAMLAQALLICQIALPGDVGRQTIALQDLPLLHRDPVARRVRSPVAVRMRWCGRRP